MLHTGSIDILHLCGSGFPGNTFRRLPEQQLQKPQSCGSMKKSGKFRRLVHRALRLRLNSRPIIVSPMWNFWQRQTGQTDRRTTEPFLYERQFCWIYNIRKIMWYMICMFLWYYCYDIIYMFETILLYTSVESASSWHWFSSWLCKFTQISATPCKANGWSKYKIFRSSMSSHCRHWPIALQLTRNLDSIWKDKTGIESLRVLMILMFSTFSTWALFDIFP